MCGGDFINKNPNEAFKVLDYAEVSRSQEEPIVKEPPRDRIVNKARSSGVYAILEGLDIQEKIATIIRRLDDLEAKKVQKVQIDKEGTMQLCLICKSMEHDVHSCPTLPIVQDIFFEQANGIGTYKQPMNNSPYSNTYFPNWKNHSNVSWGSNNNDKFQYQGNQYQCYQSNEQ